MAWGPTSGVWSVLIPLLASLLFIAFSTAMASVVPKLTQKIWPPPPTEPAGAVAAAMNEGKASCAPSPVLFLGLLGLWAVALTLAAHYARTTFLLGCFMAGVSFASEHRCVEAWEELAPPITNWTSRIFFASIGFAVPAAELFTGEALGYGALLTGTDVSKMPTNVSIIFKVHQDTFNTFIILSTVF